MEYQIGQMHRCGTEPEQMHFRHVGKPRQRMQVPVLKCNECPEYALSGQPAVNFFSISDVGDIIPVQKLKPTHATIGNCRGNQNEDEPGLEREIPRSATFCYRQMLIIHLKEFIASKCRRETGYCVDLMSVFFSITLYTSKSYPSVFATATSSPPPETEAKSKLSSLSMRDWTTVSNLLVTL